MAAQTGAVVASDRATGAQIAATLEQVNVTFSRLSNTLDHLARIATELEVLEREAPGAAITEGEGRE